MYLFINYCNSYPSPLFLPFVFLHFFSQTLKWRIKERIALFLNWFSYNFSQPSLFFFPFSLLHLQYNKKKMLLWPQNNSVYLFFLLLVNLSSLPFFCLFSCTNLHNNSNKKKVCWLNVTYYFSNIHFSPASVFFTTPSFPHHFNIITIFCLII